MERAGGGYNREPHLFLVVEINQNVCVTRRRNLAPARSCFQPFHGCNSSQLRAMWELCYDPSVRSGIFRECDRSRWFDIFKAIRQKCVAIQSALAVMSVSVTSS